MQKVKKLISVLTALVILSLCCILPANAESDKKITFSLATDVHITDKGQSITKNYPESELYFHAQNTGNLYNEAMGIFVSFLKQSQEAGVDFILVPGDMSDYGTGKQHKYFASELAKFEDESGIPVYVVPGNHDYFRSSPAEFKEYYARFGYDEALVCDDITASYTADLPGDYRLIAIDSNDPGANGDGLDEPLFSWIEAQCAAAKADGKTPIAMMHHPLLEPIPMAELLMSDFIVKDHTDVAEKFTAWGIEYVFTGHEHGNNIASYTGKNGRTVYDILTTSVSSYPLEYRTVSFSDDGVEIGCEQVKECNFDYVYGGYTEKQLDLMRSDYEAYALGYFKYSIEKKIGSVLTPAFIENALGVSDGFLYDAIETVMPLVEEALQTPLYKKDTDGVSVESLAAAVSAKLPASDYYNLYDLATTVVARIYRGNENMPVFSSPEGKILILGLNTMLKYILLTAGKQATASALNAAFASLGCDVSADELLPLDALTVPGAGIADEAAVLTLAPLLNKFLVDDDMNDREALLPAPGSTGSANALTAFFAKIKSFFDDIMKMLNSLFGKVC